MFVPLARGAAALAISLAFLTACGSDPAEPQAAATSAETSSGSSAPADSGETESITATEADFTISLDEDSLSPGSYEITVNNEGDATHDLVVARDGDDVAASDTIGPDESTTLTVDLESGTYVFYCSIGDHRDMGMEVTVTVT
jgi:plastocyanin